MTIQQWAIAGAIGLTVLITGCESRTASTEPSPSPNANESANSATESGATGSSATGSSATVGSVTASVLSSAAAALPNRPTQSPLPVPNLIPPVSVAPPATPTIGQRPDPFSMLPVTPTVVPKRQAAAVTPTTAPQPQPSSLAIATTPAIAPSGLFVPSVLPTVQPLPSMAPQPVPSPLPNLAHRIEISGVVEVGGRTNVIITVPDESSSRYVAVGDYVANGQVLVKRVDMGANAEPIVVLEQDGKEVVRTVGTPSALLLGST